MHANVKGWVVLRGGCLVCWFLGFLLVFFFFLGGGGRSQKDRSYSTCFNKVKVGGSGTKR